MKSISEHILKVENDLLKKEVRKSVERINEILSDDFVEFTSSGHEYHYKKGEVFQKENDNTQLLWEIIDFNIKQLSDNCVLAMYKVIKHDEIDEKKKYSLRSSIWKYSDKQWKMIFHQGTITKKN